MTVHQSSLILLAEVKDCERPALVESGTRRIGYTSRTVSKQRRELALQSCPCHGPQRPGYPRLASISSQCLPNSAPSSCSGSEDARGKKYTLPFSPMSAQQRQGYAFVYLSAAVPRKGTATRGGQGLRQSWNGSPVFLGGAVD